MVNTDKLRGLIAEKGFSQSDVARRIGITPKTFYEKMRKRVFYSDEIEAIIDMLNITDAERVNAIFFDQNVT